MRTVDAAELQRIMRLDFRFSDQQFAAISAPLEPAVIVAGAGSGKTAVMAARVVWLVATGQVRPEQILGLTFTNKAAAELATRVRDALRTAGFIHRPGSPLADDEDEPGEPTVATYNAYAAGLLSEHGLRIGHEPDTRVVADASRYQLAAMAVRHHRGRVEQLSESMSSVIDYVLALDGQLADHLVDPAQVLAWQRRERPQWAAASTKDAREVADVMTEREELLGLVADYRALKARYGLMDFSDQMAGGARLAEEHPEVGAAERERFRVVLLDEYQDTSVAQARMLKALFSGAPGEDGRGHPVMAVGDPSQAIYGWRGASISNILGFGRDFPLAGPGEPRRFSLTVNRRSETRILDVANRLAAPLYDLQPGSAPLAAKEEAGPGTVRAALLPTYQDELDFLAREVRAAHAAMAEPRWSEIAVLTGSNAHAADVYDALTHAGIPVEIVGLRGLIRVPEVAEVVATLEVLHDLTANAALLTLLTSPRWAIGHRDLALLGRRARILAGGGTDRQELSLDDQLAEAVSGTDLADMVALAEALDDPGPLPYSAEARERFAQLSAELRTLRDHVGEPLLDLVRRIIDTSGIDLELASARTASAPMRRENLATFVEAVSGFSSVEGDVSLPALLAYLNAEDEFGTGLDAASPSAADSVKLLTTYKAKGLEWDVVFLAGVCEERLPRTKGRSQWPKARQVVPNCFRGDADDLPDDPEPSSAGLREFTRACKEQDAVEQRRLGYVAFTRARRTLVASAYWWEQGRKKRLGPSAYLTTLVDAMAEWGLAPEVWTAEPEEDADNPVLVDTRTRAWPSRPDEEEVARRRASAELVRAAIAEQEWEQADDAAADALSEPERARLAAWDDEIDRLLEEARAGRADVVDVPLPSSLSATALAQLRDDPERLAASLARPMPRKPSPAARFGTRFHAWVEASFGQQQILDPEDLPGRSDAEIDDESDLHELIERFRRGPFGDRSPVAVEPPFALVLGGQVVRGRIDAVYEDGDGYLVVDWKTNREQTADPLQLAIYRVAWAELTGVPVERVRAAFYYVRSGDVVEYGEDLPGRRRLEELVSVP